MVEKRKKNIMILSSHTFDVFGGYEKTLLTILNRMKNDYNIKILSAPFNQTLLKNDVLKEFESYKIYRFSDYKNKLHYRLNFLIHKLLHKKFFINYRGIFDYLNSLPEKPDLIIITEPLLINTARRVITNLNLNCKIAYWDHGALNCYFTLNRTRFFHKKEIVESIKEADFHLAISSAIENLILVLNPYAKIYKVFNPVEQYNGKLIFRPKQPIFLYVGRIEETQKNLIFTLFGLSKIHKNWKLIIVGDGPDSKKIKNLAKKLKIDDKIEWRGFKKDPYENLNEGVTALLLTSRWEGFPLVLVEANIRGIPAIVSNFSGASDIIINGKNGYIFQQNNMEEFIKIINDVIDGKLTFDTPENISKTADRFSEDKVYNNIIQAINNELKK